MPLPLFVTLGVAVFAPVTLAATAVMPVAFVRLLPLASFAWTVIVVTLPAVPAGTVAVEAVALTAPGFTVNAADVPAWVPPEDRVAVIVKLPVLESVTACELNTPLVNVAVVPPPAESVPVDVMV